MILCFCPIAAFAASIDTSVEGYDKLLNMMQIYVRGAGAIVLMLGSGDFFISLSSENTERIVRAMQMMGAGCFLMLADSFVKAIGNADGPATFRMLYSMIGVIISFIGVVLAVLGAYNTFNSIKERSAENRSKAIKVLFSGLMLLAISQSLSSFI